VKKNASSFSLDILNLYCPGFEKQLRTRELKVGLGSSHLSWQIKSPR